MNFWSKICVKIDVKSDFFSKILKKPLSTCFWPKKGLRWPNLARRPKKGPKKRPLLLGMGFGDLEEESTKTAVFQKKCKKFENFEFPLEKHWENFFRKKFSKGNSEKVPKSPWKKSEKNGSSRGGEHTWGPLRSSAWPVIFSKNGRESGLIRRPFSAI
jgi:hypothetical protein